MNEIYVSCLPCHLYVHNIFYKIRIYKYQIANREYTIDFDYELIITNLSCRVHRLYISLFKILLYLSMFPYNATVAGFADIMVKSNIFKSNCKINCWNKLQ